MVTSAALMSAAAGKVVGSMIFTDPAPGITRGSCCEKWYVYWVSG